MLYNRDVVQIFGGGEVAKPRKKTRFSAAEQGRQFARVAAYLRVSTEEQARSGLGLSAQRAKVEAMATVKDWPPPLFYVDEGISGTKESRNRPALAQMMDAAAAGEIDAIIVNSIDRLARKARLTLELAEEFQRYGVTLVSCKENIDTTTPAGQLFLTVLAGMAQFERDLIADRTRVALAEHSRRDGESGGRLPYGYAREEKGLRIERDQARIVRRIFTLRQSGLTLRAIAAHLNKRGYASPQGRHWHHSSVAAVLANEDYYRGGLRGASVLRWPVILKVAKSMKREERMDDSLPYAERFAEAQKVDAYEIRGRDYPRIKYGDESNWTANTNGCHDCGAKPGQFHLPGCDVERCPRCGGQSISCGCDDLDDSQLVTRGQA